MAYNVCERFSKVQQSVRLLDPGAYQDVNSIPVKQNKVAFLSNLPRNTQGSGKIWTHAIYFGDIKPKIPNCTSFLSNTPRFVHEKFENDDVEEILCQCGAQNPCNCSAGKEKAETKDDVKCNKNVRRRLFKGQTPRSEIKEEVPFEKNHGSNDSPPFYDARVVESTAFYRGWKWSRWTSQRGDKSINLNPGPADYSIDGIEPDHAAKCIERLRASKRKTSKQLRYIEKVQRQNTLEALPGPSTYRPTYPHGTNLQFLGPKAERFTTSKFQITPDPTSHFIQRDFDIDRSPFKPCHAKLPIPAPFGGKDRRFKYRPEQGPSPASYNISNLLCQLAHNNTAPFGSTSKRFKDHLGQDSQSEDDENIENDVTEQNQQQSKSDLPCWMFRSKTIRIKPLEKTGSKSNQTGLSKSSHCYDKRLLQYQYNCPFYSSEAKFQNWFNWVTVHGEEKTPGPGYYNAEKPKCWPAVKNGPISLSKRFASHSTQNPAPNRYNVEGGIESVLTTYNEKLKNNIKNAHKYVWKVPVEQRKLSINEQVDVLLDKSIALLDVPDVFERSKRDEKKFTQPQPPDNKNFSYQKKMLQCFLYTQQVKPYF